MLPKPDFCHPCIGYNWDDGKGFSEVTGEGHVPLLFVGEASGRTEFKTGRPFTGQAGQVLEKALRTAGLKRSDYLLTNLIRCSVPGNLLLKQPYERAALDHCRKYLNDVVAERQPRIIVALGEVPFRELSAVSGLQSELRGFCLPSIYDGVHVIGTYHPSRILRGGWKLFGILRHDIRRAVSFARNGIPPRLPTNYIHSPTIDQIRDYIGLLRSQPLLPISYDSETPELIGQQSDGKTIMLLQFSSAIGTGMTLEPHQFDAAREIMALPNPKWDWAGRTFDRPLLRTNGFVLNGETHDLMNCLRGDTRIKLWDGTTKLIKEIVENRLPVTLVGMDDANQQVPVKVIDWHHKKRSKRFPDLKWVKIVTDVNRYPLYTTPDHQVWTQDGWKDAQHVKVGDLVPVATRGATDVLQGMLLGDSFYSVPARSIHTTHSVKQSKYAEALANYLGVRLHSGRNSRNPEYGIVYFQVVASKRWRFSFYPIDNYKRFNEPLSNRAVAIWYMDDGCFQKYRGKLAKVQTKKSYTHHQGDGRAVLALSPEFYEEIERIETVLSEMFGDQISYARAKGKRGGWITLKRNTRDRFFDAIASYIHPSMQYKLPTRYHGRYNGWMERPEPQWAVVTGVDADPYRRAYFSTDEYCVTVDHPTHRFFAMGGLVANCWAHLQPDLMSGRDDTNDEKSIPAKLMSLQSYVSMYMPWELPWKQMVKWFMVMHPDADPMPTVKEYGCRDVDFTTRVGYKLFDALRRVDLYDGYREHKYEVSFVLDDLHDEGLPVDRERQSTVRQQIDDKAVQLSTELQVVVPLELRPVKTYRGWPKDLREVVKAAGLYVKNCKPEQFPEHVATCGYELNGSLIKRLPFNPNSHQQLLAYIQYQVDGEREALWDAPNECRWYVPLHIDTKQPTTGQKEIEALIEETDDAVLKLVSKARKLTKLGGTYCGGEWVPGEDGRVHGTFRFGTASGQTSCTKPNQQQWPSHYDPDDKWLVPIMQQIKGCIRAEPGHVFVKIDAKGAHARQQAFLAEDPGYYRLSNLGTHAFVTAHYVGTPDRNELLAMDDVSLLKRFGEIKRQYDWEYNFAKRVSFNMAYLGGAEKAAHTLRVSVVEVMALMEMIKKLFPRSFIEYPESVRQRLRKSPKLVSAHKSCRWIWNDDVQQAVAFCVANEFHCHWQSGLVRLRKRGLTKRYSMVNFCHDDAWFHPTEELAEECIAECRAELEKPSNVLVNSLGHFQVNTEVQWGPDMNSLEDV